MAGTDMDNELFDSDDENLAAEAPDIAPEEEMKDIAPQEEMKDIALQEEMTGSAVSIHSSGFRDLPLKPELLRAIKDCGFQNPSEVQNECLPQAIQGMDILCQAMCDTGKTAAYVLATLQQLEPIRGPVSVLVLVHTRDLAFKISNEYERFSKYMPSVKVAVFHGGCSINNDEKMLKICPRIVVGTPGRILTLARSKILNLGHIKHLILDECDKMLERLNFRTDIEKIFHMTPREKQVMMFSATLGKKTRPVCRQFMQDVITNSSRPFCSCIIPPAAPACDGCQRDVAETNLQAPGLGLATVLS